MVQSFAPTVDAYLAEASAERAETLRALRDLARRVLADHEERMQWGMPVYVRDDKIRFGFAEQKQYVSLYFMNSQALRKNAKALAGQNMGKGCLRFRKSAPIDWTLIEKLLRDTRGSARAR